jgi:hypothetical protein
MRIFLIGFVVVVGLIILIGGGIFLYTISVGNSEVELRNRAAAEQKANEAIFDNVWKTIAQQANVKDDYKEDFRKSWTDIVSAQNSGARNGGLKVFINRFNPKLDSSIYKKLMNTIEGQRKEFLTAQKKLIDIKREHDNLRTRRPSKWVVGDVPELEIKIITSQRTGDVFESGQDNDISLRPGQKDAPKEEPKK